MSSLLKILVKDGKIIPCHADIAKSRPESPMTLEGAAVKFTGCAESAEWPKDKTEKIISYAGALDSARDLSAFVLLLSAKKG